MSQPPYGQGADPYPSPYQSPQAAVGGGLPPSAGAPPPSGYGPPAQGGYGAPQGGYPGGTPPYGSPPGYPGGPTPYGIVQAPKSKTGLIIATVVGILAIGGIILAVVLVNKVPGPDPLVQGDDPALNQLALSCFDGNMSDCDSLFLQSPAASTYEAYGNTCGGRIAETDVDQRYCVDIF